MTSSPTDKLFIPPEKEPMWRTYPP